MIVPQIVLVPTRAKVPYFNRFDCGYSPEHSVVFVLILDRAIILLGSHGIPFECQLLLHLRMAGARPLVVLSLELIYMIDLVLYSLSLHHNLITINDLLRAADLFRGLILLCKLYFFLLIVINV